MRSLLLGFLVLCLTACGNTPPDALPDVATSDGGGATSFDGGDGSTFDGGHASFDGGGRFDAGARFDGGATFDGGDATVDARRAVSSCNPVTNEGCAGVCSLTREGAFSCHSSSDPVELCGDCGPLGGPFCGAGMGCDTWTLKCTRYCCDDGDCGTTTCDMTNAIDGVGECALGGGAVGCDQPSAAPSGGTCYTGG